MCYAAEEQVVTVISPNGGEVLKLGGSYEVKWEVSGLPFRDGAMIEFRYGGSGYPNLLATTTNEYGSPSIYFGIGTGIKGSGSVIVNVPYNLWYYNTELGQWVPLTKDIPVKVRISNWGWYSGDPSTWGCDESDAPFTIESPSGTCVLADIIPDGKVDLRDVFAVARNYGKTGEGLLGDIDNNGTVDLKDVFAVNKCYGFTY